MRNKAEFLMDLVQALGYNKLPCVFGGDFNLIRRINERNKIKKLPKWSFYFNSIIEHWGLKELDLSGRSYTWSNNQEDPLFAKLDRILVSSLWEQQFPLVTVRTLVRGVSDHAALLLHTGIKSTINRKPFKFELCWLSREELPNIVNKVWSSTVRRGSSLDWWQDFMRKLRRTLKGWNLNVEGRYRRDRDEIANKLDFLDKKSELSGVSEADYVLRNKLQNDLNKILREEEIKWYQRSKEKDIKEGDGNTKYFMIKASGRKRRSKIFRFIQDEGIIQGDEQLLKYATDFYKKLFGPVELLPVSLNIPLTDMLSDEDKSKLASKFTLDEIKTAVFSMRHNRAAGPDGMPIEFFQTFWHLICNDLLSLFQDFYDDMIDISRLNYGVVTLLAKGQGADRIQMYRPICMLNVPFKIFTKVLNNRAMTTAHKTISKVQSAFIKGRYILDNVAVLHETLHSLHKSKCDAVIFKVDFEKAYDKINWDFMLSTLKMKGFPDKFIRWTKAVIHNGKVAITLNDLIGPYFVTRKGLRQGDPFSPLLFNLAADFLATLVQRAQ